MSEPSAPGTGEGRHGVDPLPVTDEGLLCSSKGCRADATWDLRWNNPKIHPEDRRKHWMACDGHRDQLRSFLSTRGFLREVEPLGADAAR